MQLFLKILSGMANNVDPGQTLGLHCLHIQFVRKFGFDTSGHLPNILIKFAFKCIVCSRSYSSDSFLSNVFFLLLLYYERAMVVVHVIIIHQ